MEIEIIKKSTGELIASYQIILRSLNSSVSKEEYFSEAWQCAVEDKVVKDDERAEYSFRFAK